VYGLLIRLLCTVSECQPAIPVLSICTCECVEAKRRAAKQNIKEAMASQDIDSLKRAIADGSGVLNESELAQAKKLLDFLKISQGRIMSVYILFVNL